MSRFCTETLKFAFAEDDDSDDDSDESDDEDADNQILESDEDEIDEESAVYLESLQEKLNKSCNGNLSVSTMYFRYSSQFVAKVYCKLLESNLCKMSKS